MNILLWILQILTALLYGASGIMKVFMFDKVSKGVPSFGALPRKVWTTLGLLELISTVCLIIPPILHWHPILTVIGAGVLAIESIVFVGVHIKYHEMTSIIMSIILGILMAFITYGRLFLQPFS